MKLVNLAIDNPGAEGKRKFQRWSEHEASPRMTRFLFSQYAYASDVKMSQSDSSCKQAEKGVKESSHYASRIYPSFWTWVTLFSGSSHMVASCAVSTCSRFFLSRDQGSIILTLRRIRRSKSRVSRALPVRI